MRSAPIRSGEFARYVVIALSIACVVAVSWVMSDVFVLAFGGVVLAAALRAVAAPLIHRTRLPERWCIVFVILGLLVLFGAFAWAFGEQLSQQVKGLRTQLPNAITRVKEWLHASELGRTALDLFSAPADGTQLVGGFAKFAGAALGILANALLILFVGIYLALDPKTYLRGLLHLLPLKHRSKVESACVESGAALRKWLIGQLVVMVVVGVLTGVGLSLIGIESALALGLLAGLCEFVPVIGPIVSAIPGLLLAALGGGEKMFYALLVYVAVQQLEGILATPIAQRWSVHMPPALTLLSVVAVGLLFGTLGVIFATPLTVVVLVLVQKLYVRRLEKNAGPEE